jgi:F0F1-type ATP synthase membrane subunit c/vacuolar-type H+-ATPase subunit K
MTELSYAEMQETDGGSLTAAGVAVGLLGFGAGVVIGFAVVAAVYYCVK